MKTFNETFIQSLANRKIYIKAGFTNGGYCVSTLATLALCVDKEAFFVGAVFAFCSSSKKSIRFVLWENNGYWMIERRILTKTFQWPRNCREKEDIQVAATEIKVLLASPDYKF